MTQAKMLAVFMLLGAAAVLALAAAPAMAQQGAQDQPDPDPWGWGELFSFDGEASMPASHDANVAAFLAMIRAAEGTANAPDPYRVCYAYRHTLQSLADHPKVTGEWMGEKLSDGMCARAGYGPGCVSTAAGAYQIIAPTWARAKKALRLPSFEPAQQDAAAVWLLQQAGALDDVRAGRVQQALARQGVRDQWASLPGNSAGQGQRSVGELLAWFQASGGAIA